MPFRPLAPVSALYTEKHCRETGNETERRHGWPACRSGTRPAPGLTEKHCPNADAAVCLQRERV